MARHPLAPRSPLLPVAALLLLASGINFAAALASGSTYATAAKDQPLATQAANDDAGMCTHKTCGALDPVNDPDYNMRNIAKQSILLEEHLACKCKLCLTCALAKGAVPSLPCFFSLSSFVTARMLDRREIVVDTFCFAESLAMRSCQPVLWQ